MFCSKCGAELEEESKFCSKCGEKVNKIIPIDLNEIGSNVTDSIKNFDTDKVKEKVKTTYGKGKKYGVYIGGVIILLLMIWMSTNAHKCDSCGKTFFGPEYYDSWDTNKVMCEECAREYYAPLPYKNYRK